MINTEFQPFPELQTERLLLRKLAESDAEEIFFLRSDAKVLRYIDKEPAKTIDEIKEFIDRINKNAADGNAIMWGIVLKEDGEGEKNKVIGNICLWQLQREHYRAEIGYTLHPDHWRKGIMKEAMSKVVDFSFSYMKLHNIEAKINPDNAGSAAVLESTGFVREAYFKENYFFKGKFLDTAIYSKLNK